MAADNRPPACRSIFSLASEDVLGFCPREKTKKNKTSEARLRIYYKTHTHTHTLFSFRISVERYIIGAIIRGDSADEAKFCQVACRTEAANLL